MKQLLDICNFSARTFRRQWNKRFTVSPMKLLNRCRLDKAVDLLIETDLSIAEIAYKVGYEDPFYFTRKFIQYKNVPPNKFRRERTGPGKAVPR